MFIKEFVSYYYLDIIIPLLVLYLIFLIIAYVKNRNN